MQPTEEKITPLPELPAGIVKHAKLGELYDRLQVQQYAVAYADLCAKAKLEELTKDGEAVVFEIPDYHEEAMGCGLEERDLAVEALTAIKARLDRNGMSGRQLPEYSLLSKALSAIKESES